MSDFMDKYPTEKTEVQKEQEKDCFNRVVRAELMAAINRTRAKRMLEKSNLAISEELCDSIYELVKQSDMYEIMAKIGEVSADYSLEGLILKLIHTENNGELGEKVRKRYTEELELSQKASQERFEKSGQLAELEELLKTDKELGFKKARELDVSGINFSEPYEITAYGDTSLVDSEFSTYHIVTRNGKPSLVRANEQTRQC